MTGTAPRLRWYEGNAGDLTAFRATVDTSSACLFKILRPSSGYPDWALVTQLPGAQSEARYAEDGPEAIEKLKAEAERWLVECVASLGAVFPDPEG